MLAARHATCPLLLLALLAQCGTHQEEARARPLRIGIDLWAGYYPLVLAEELGYLREEAVEVELSIPKNTDRMLADFAAGDYDAICASIGDVVTLTRNVRDLRLILLSDESSGGDQILAREPIHDASQLRGKRIGTNLGGFGELFVRRMLASYGLQPDEVQWVDIDAADMPEQLRRHEIDIGHTWEPYASQAIADGMKCFYSSAETPGLILDGVIARGATLQNRADDLRRMAKAWLRAVDWWREHAAEGDRRIEAKLGLQAGEARPIGIRILDARANRDLMCAGTTPPLEVATTQFVDFFVSRGLLLRRPEPRSLFDSHFLP